MLSSSSQIVGVTSAVTLRGSPPKARASRAPPQRRLAAAAAAPRSGATPRPSRLPATCLSVCACMLSLPAGDVSRRPHLSWPYTGAEDCAAVHGGDTGTARPCGPGGVRAAAAGDADAGRRRFSREAILASGGYAAAAERLLRDAVVVRRQQRDIGEHGRTTIKPWPREPRHEAGGGELTRRRADAALWPGHDRCCTVMPRKLNLHLTRAAL